MAKKEKFDIHMLSDEELIAYYKKRNTQSMWSYILYPSGSFILSSALSSQDAIVFVPAITAYLALGGVMIFRKSGQVAKARDEINNRDLMRRLKFSYIKGTKQYEEKKEECIDAYHKLIQARLQLTEDYGDICYDLLALQDCKDEKNLEATKLALTFQKDEVVTRVKEVDKAIDDYLFLLDTEKSVSSNPIPRETLSLESIDEKVKQAYEDKKLLDTKTKKPMLEKNSSMDNFVKLMFEFNESCK